MTTPKTQLGTHPYPKTRRTGHSAWDRLVDKDMQRHLRLNPGKNYSLCGEDGKPLPLIHSDYTALLQSCPKPYRVQSVSTDGEDQKGRPNRFAWISFDPGYWEHIKKLRTQKQASPKSEKKGWDPKKHPKKPCVRCGIEFQQSRGINMCRDCRDVEGVAA